MTAVVNADAAPAEAESLRVELGERSYEVVVSRGLLGSAGSRMRRVLPSQRVILVTDENVAPLYLDELQASLSDEGFRPRIVVLPAGEKTKDFVHLQHLVERVLEIGVDRSSALVALGGGVIGDLTGFAAGVLLRGLAYVQVPTTLLAQVDSSVGGKTGINTRQGKNLVGVFHQPRLVLADVETLATLEQRQILAGYAEVVKYGLIIDEPFFTWLEANGAALCAGECAAQQRAVMVSCAAKAGIVASDEQESGRRALLNFGHTFGHALEAELGFRDRLLHGEAVAIGIRLAFDLSVRLGLCAASDSVRVHQHLLSIGLPTIATLSDLSGQPLSTDRLVRHMMRDKKARDGRITFILARGIGKAFVASGVCLEDVSRLLKDSVRG